MVLKRHITAVLFVALSSVVVCAQSDQSQSAKPAPRSGSIRGRVLTESGQPIPNASVFVSASTNPPTVRRTASDTKGLFQFDHLDVALYTVSASAPGYIQPPRDPDNDQPIFFRLGDEITFHLVKGGVITGAVTNPAGEPLVGISVRALMVRDVNGKPSKGFSITSERFTDDRGVYRLYGLRPGSYVVATGGRSNFGALINGYETDAPTYAPSSVRETAAEVNVVAGAESAGVDIRHRGEEGRRVSGSVVSPNMTAGSFSTSVNLRKVRGGTYESTFNLFMGQQLSFEFYGIADGEYVVEAQTNVSLNEIALSEPKRITVKGADISGIALTTQPLATLAGRIALEPSSAPECKGKRRPLFEETLVTSSRMFEEKVKEEPRPTMFTRMQTLGDKNGQFLVRFMSSGKYNLSARVPAKYWFLRGISTQSSGPRPAASDVARSGLTVKNGERAKVTITLTEGAASLRGTIKREGPGGLPSGLVAFLVPAEREAGENPLRFYATTVEANGQFVFSNLSPGSYRPILRRIEPEDPFNLTTFRNVEEVGNRSKLLREAESKKLVVDLKPCQNIVDFELNAGS